MTEGPGTKPYRPSRSPPDGDPLPPEVLWPIMRDAAAPGPPVQEVKAVGALLLGTTLRRSGTATMGAGAAWAARGRGAQRAGLAAPPGATASARRAVRAARCEAGLVDDDALCPGSTSGSAAGRNHVGVPRA